MKSTFEAQLQGVESALESSFGSQTDATKNLAVLNHLLSLSRFALEAFLSRGSIIALDETDYERIREKVRQLIALNQASPNS